MKKLTSVSFQAALVGGLGLLIHHASSTGAGFAVPEVSALGTATANAVVANAEEKGAFAYNPSAMGFHDESSVSVGALFIGPQFEVKTQTGTNDSDGADWLTAPQFQAAFKVHEQWRIGLGVNAPFGLETRWKTGTFPKLSATVPVPFPPPLGVRPIPTGAHPTSSKLEIVTLVPSATYKVNDDLSVSGGLDYYKANAARLDSDITTLTGDGDGWGWNASLLYRHDAWSFGATYHSSATVDLDGDYAPLNGTLALLGMLDPTVGLPPPQGATLDLNLPWRIQLGVRYAVNDALAVEFDWTRTGWSEFDELVVKSAAGGHTLFRDVNAWNDSNAYRLGVTYDVMPATQLRFGYAFDETGQDDDHFSARVPDNDRHLLSIGVGQDLGQGWVLDAGYMYVLFKDRDYRGSRPYAGLGTDVNGTDAIAGEYDANAHLLALEVSKAF